jgi:hypothetical protein
VNKTKYKVTMSGETIIVMAGSVIEATILAQAQAIKNGKDWRLIKVEYIDI